jgi:hypothetical protein
MGYGMKQKLYNIVILIIAVLFFFTCKIDTPVVEDPADEDGSSDTTNPTVTVSNLHNNGIIESGFIIGTANDDTAVASVEIKLDNGNYSVATGTTTWKYQLPIGGDTWGDGTQHTIRIRSKDGAGNYSSEIVRTVRKGVNKDINGDGYTDLAVGAEYFSTQKGRAYIFEGGASGVSGQDLSSTGSASTTLTGEATNSYFGKSVALGDINGDGYADIAVGADFYLSQPGSVYIFEGSQTGIQDLDLSGSGSADTILEGEVIEDRFGFTLAMGDVNGDGYADLAVGAHYYGSEQGKVYIFNGSSSGISDQDLSSSGSADTVLAGEASNNNFGWSIALGDVDGDGFSDCAIGAYGYNSLQGRVYIFEGGGSGISDQDLSGTGTADTTLTGGATSNRFGSCVSFGDVDGDGYADIAVGAQQYDMGRGRVYIFEGSIAGISDQGTGTADTTLTCGDGSQLFGVYLTLGDTDADSYADLAVGAMNYSSQKGRVYIFEGGNSGISDQDLSASGSADAILTGETASTVFGIASAIGDFNSDGYSDVCIGATNYDSSRGRVYIFEGGSSGISDQDLSSGGSADAIITGEATSNRLGWRLDG